MDFDEMQKLLGSIMNDEEPETQEQEHEEAASAVSVSDDTHEQEAAHEEAETPVTESVQEDESGDFDFDELLSQFASEDAADSTAADDVPEFDAETNVAGASDAPSGGDVLHSEEPSDDGPRHDHLGRGAEPETEVSGTTSLDDILSSDAGDQTGSNEIIFKPDAVKPDAIPAPQFTTEELAETLDIRNYASLVTLNTGRWHGKVKDKKASESAAQAAGADAAAFETQKRLLAGAEEKLKRVHKAIDDARSLHYRMTLPWSTIGRSDQGKRTGGRLLPHTMFQEYIAAMSKAKAEMDAAADDFESGYTDAINTARQHLGSRFDPTEYPSPTSIRSHFGLAFDFHPIPIGADFQGLADQQVAKLANSLEKKNRVMLENAMQEAWSRLYELVGRAAEKFSDPEAMFHYTLIDQLRDAASSFRYLNVTNDPVIEKVRAAVEKNLTMHDAKSIRGDEALRKRLGEIARACLKEMQDYGS